MNTSQRPPSMLNRASGIIFIITTLLCAPGGWFILGKLHKYRTNPNYADSLNTESVPDYLVLLIEHRFIFLGLCLPALLGGVMLILNRKPRGAWYALAMLGEFVMIGALFVSIFAFLAPLYQYQEL